MDGNVAKLVDMGFGPEVSERRERSRERKKESYALLLHFFLPLNRWLEMLLR
jgi:hypothetical protein